MKTTTEILDKMNKDKKRRDELKKIREERKKINTFKNPQKRRIEILEHIDGTYSLVGFAWKLPLQKEEVLDAVKNWVDGSLEKGKELKF